MNSKDYDNFEKELLTNDEELSIEYQKLKPKYEFIKLVVEYSRRNLICSRDWAELICVDDKIILDFVNGNNMDSKLLWKISNVLINEEGDNSIDLFSVANYFYKKSNKYFKKVNLLCWYAYSWYIFLNNEKDELKYDKLFTENAEAWVHGAVFRELHTDFKYNNKINTINAEDINNKEILSFLDSIYREYGDFTGDELESINQQELPWIRARKDLKPYESSNKIIQDKDIFDEYKNR